MTEIQPAPVGSGCSNPIIGGGGTLVYPAIHSPNYVPAASGWSINKDGSAQFNSLAIGSTSAGNTTIDTHGNVIVTNSHGAIVMYFSAQQAAFFQYRDLGSAVQGQLILAISSVAGTDPVTGAAYPVGMYGVDFVFGSSMQVTGASITLRQVSYTRNASIGAFVGGGASEPTLIINAPEQTTTSHLQMFLTGESPDGTKVAQLVIGAVSGSASLSPLGQDLLEVQGIQALVEPTGTSQALNVVAVGDTFSRYKLRADGLMNWGPGNVTQDTTLYRAGAALLAADNIAANVSGVAETWHAMTLQNGWANTGGVTEAAQYRQEPDNSVWLVGDISGGTITSGTIIATLPVGYRTAAHTVNKPLMIFAGAAAAPILSPTVSLDSSGNVIIHNVPAGTTRIGFDCKIKQDS